MGRNECGSNAMVTVEEYLEMKSRQEAKEVPVKQKNLVYGLEGIKTLFGCSTTTAWRIKNSEWIRPAISQVGRKIMVDADLPRNKRSVSGLFHGPKYFSFNGISLYKLKESFLKKK